jgi:hypothetical protein
MADMKKRKLVVDTNKIKQWTVSEMSMMEVQEDHRTRIRSITSLCMGIVDAENSPQYFIKRRGSGYTIVITAKTMSYAQLKKVEQYTKIEDISLQPNEDKPNTLLLILDVEEDKLRSSE